MANPATTARATRFSEVLRYRTPSATSNRMHPHLRRTGFAVPGDCGGTDGGGQDRSGALYFRKTEAASRVAWDIHRLAYTGDLQSDVQPRREGALARSL